MAKILISDKLSPAAVDIFRGRGIEVDMQDRPVAGRPARHHRRL